MKTLVKSTLGAAMLALIVAGLPASANTAQIITGDQQGQPSIAIQVANIKANAVHTEQIAAVGLPTTSITFAINAFYVLPPVTGGQALLATANQAIGYLDTNPTFTSHESISAFNATKLDLGLDPGNAAVTGHTVNEKEAFIG